MYGFNEEITVFSKERILSEFSQQGIAEKLITGKPVVFYDRMISPFREDLKADCYFEWYKEKLWFIDFADRPTHRDIFNMVQDKYKLTFREALRKISKEYCCSQLMDTENTVNIEVQDEIKKDFYPIIFKTRNFQDRDRDYWMPYGISKTNLIEDGVYPLIWFKFHSHKLNMEIVIRPQEICYAYTEITGKAKIYRPLNKTGKWITNCNANDIFNINNIDATGKQLLITKAYKDNRVVRNTGRKNTIAFQNEGAFPSDEILLDLCERFEFIIILFDNDASGIEAAVKLQQHISELSKNPYKASYIFIPADEYPETKDYAELYKNFGQTVLNNFLEENNI